MINSADPLAPICFAKPALCHIMGTTVFRISHVSGRSTIADFSDWEKDTTAKRSALYRV